MLIKVKRGWEMRDSEATPESVFLNRRTLVKAMGVGTILAGAGLPLGDAFAAAARRRHGRSVGRASIPPSATTNTRSTGRSPTRSTRPTTTISTNTARTRTSPIAAQQLKIRPWTITIDGMVEKPMTIGIDDLLEAGAARRAALSPSLRRGVVDGGAVDRLPAEEPRRPGEAAVERDLSPDDDLQGRVDGAGPEACFWYPWPYVEGLTMAEATNELAFMVTGMYGKPVPKQDGAPLRLATPWKYGFKSVKSIVKFTFTDKRPVTFWQALQAERIRLLGQCESGGAASALEPGDRARARHQRARADPDLERLWRVRRVDVRQPQGRKAVRLNQGAKYRSSLEISGIGQKLL